MKRISIVLAITMALCLAFAGSAYANFGPHGGYVNDTDACAGCHRAHTSFSEVTWIDDTATPTEHTALLVGSASTMVQFCNACHGDTAPGASTNVVSGVFDSGPSADVGRAAPAASGTNGARTAGQSASLLTTPGASQAATAYPSDGGAVNPTRYQTASTFNAPLNGGGFSRMPDPYAWEGNASVAYVAATSAHQMGQSGAVLWGAGSASTQTLNLDCSSCHDPHGTSNYRLLKASVNGQTVGGYEANGLTPNAFVFSNEQGYPIPNSDPANMVGGWLKHEAGAAQMANYRPNYTDTTGTVIMHQDNASTESLSVWCAACHTSYVVRTGQNLAGTGTYRYGNLADTLSYEPIGATAANGVGAQLRHRHPVDITMQNGVGGNRTLVEEVTASTWVPLEHNVNPAATQLKDQWIGCLSCHRAHGSSVEMTGYAAAHLAKNAAGIWSPVQDGIPGVDPIKGTYTGVADAGGSSSLLRANNRGVCERCHNK